MLITVTTFAPGELAHGAREHSCHDDFEGRLSRPVAATSKKTLPGYSFGAFRGDHRRKELFEGADAIGLDIDGGCDLAAVLAAFGKFAGYVTSTPSSTPETPRWRPVLWLAERMTNVDDYERVIAWAQRLAPGKVDTGTGDASRFWYYGWAGAAHFVHAGLVGDPIDGCAIAAQERAREERAAADRRAVRFAPTPPTDGSYAERALSKACTAVANATEGERHDLLCREAWNMGTLVGAGVIARATVIGALHSAAARVFPENRHRELVRTLEGQLDLGAQTPRQIRRSPWGS